MSECVRLTPAPVSLVPQTPHEIAAEVTPGQPDVVVQLSGGERR